MASSLRRRRWFKQVRPISERLMRLGLFLARVLPRPIGYPLVQAIAWLWGLFSPHARGILESNLLPVLGENRCRRRWVALQVFVHAARQYYEMFYLPSVPPAKIATMVHFDEPGWSHFLEAYRSGKGVVLVAPHLSSFDLAGQAITARGYPMLVLVLPEQERGFLFLNRLREFQKTRIMPVGPKALRAALRVLSEGGIVVTGADRPVKGQGVEVEFFGRPTLLPDGHVRLALHTDANLFLAYCRREKGEYRVNMLPIELVRGGEREACIRENVQHLARAMEPCIRAHPEQWHLFQQLWD